MANDPRTETAKSCLVKFAVTCPICTASSTQYRLNPRLFWSKDVDVDLQPRTYQYLKGAEAFFPPFYYMWHCPQCHFTAGYKYFSEPMKGVMINIEMVRVKVNEAFSKDRNFGVLVEKLSDGIVSDDLNALTAIKVHLLGILFMDLFEEMVKQHFVNRGRYYLRLAWLFRDVGADPAMNEAYGAAIRETLEQLRPCWPEIPASEKAALRQAVECYGRSAEGVHVAKTVTERVGLRELVARIWVKLGEFTEAQQILFTVGEDARRERTRIDLLLRSDSAAAKALTRDQRDDLVSQSRHLATTAENSQRLIESIREQVLTQQMEKARVLLAAAGNRPAAELRDLLAQNRIGKRVIDQLVEEKRGLFGFKR